ncbi:hypothetical protein HYW44_05275 [Candidatus Daviesbacteria bacterium]|nr:hypothetical protein [Candidatus Daviesbacteria bacterium]
MVFADGLADLVLPDLVASFPFGLADAEAEALGLGSKLGEGVTDGAITTSGEGVGSGVDVTLSRSQTKYVPSKIIIRMITTIVILRLIKSPPPDSCG